MSLIEYDKFKIKEPYYNGYRLLSTLDREKKKPEIFCSTSNRSAGKSTFFNGFLVHEYIQKNKKFCILYRNKYETENAAAGFFGEIEKYFYNGLSMKQETGVKNVFDRLFIGEASDPSGQSWEHCGYVTSISASDQLKKYSHLLNDSEWLILDEVFPENPHAYLSNEIYKLMSVHDSLARGNGKQSRYLPLILVGNLIDVFNPYYETWGIVDDLQLETNFYRGNGFVVEQGFNLTSAKEHSESPFHRAFTNSDYTKASTSKEYINTNYQFIDNKVADIGRYLLTIAYKNHLFSVRYNDAGYFYYVSDKPDPKAKMIHAATMDDISDKAIYDPRNYYRKMLKDKLKLNQLKFKNLQCRSAAMHFLAGK